MYEKVPNWELGTMFSQAEPENYQRVPVGTIVELLPKIYKYPIFGKTFPVVIGKADDEYYPIWPRQLKGLIYYDGKLTKVLETPIKDDILTYIKKNHRLKLLEYKIVIADEYGKFDSQGQSIKKETQMPVWLEL